MTACKVFSPKCDDTQEIWLKDKTNTKAYYTAVLDRYWMKQSGRKCLTSYCHAVLPRKWTDDTNRWKLWYHWTIWNFNCCRRRHRKFRKPLDYCIAINVEFVDKYCGIKLFNDMCKYIFIFVWVITMMTVFTDLRLTVIFEI